MIAAHTTEGPDEGLTAGSLSVLQAGPALRHVGAVVRALAGPTDAQATYVERIAELDPMTDLTRAAVAEAVAMTAVGRSEARLDLPDKVLGRPRYLADLRPDGLLTAACCGRRHRVPPCATSTRLEGTGRRARTRRLLPRNRRRAGVRRRAGARPAGTRRALGRAGLAARRGRPARLAARRRPRGDRGRRRRTPGGRDAVGVVLQAVPAARLDRAQRRPCRCGTATGCTSGATARASTHSVTRSPRRCRSTRRRSWSSTSRTQAATATTRPTTPRSTPCCSHAPCPAARSRRAGPGPTS